MPSSIIEQLHAEEDLGMVMITLVPFFVPTEIMASVILASRQDIKQNTEVLT